ncbi:MAG: methylmalonyl Co-A mutase-associated GTPase MeaB [Acidimicrobiales bacterium]
MSAAGGSGDPASLLELASGGAAGDRRALARLLSIVERGGAPARKLSAATARLAGGAYAVGLTGAPGSGKSTLASTLVGEVRRRRRAPVAVLAVDPSSPLSGGAILGDRVRMQEHSLEEDVFIRSMATRGHLGGLAAAVPDAVRLLDATGWRLVLVETVGVGQVEVEVAGTCDTVVVVVNPGWGDAVQANKAGLLEIADVLVINKADRPGVRDTRRDLAHMLQLSTALSWTPPIVETVATSNDGVAALFDAVEAHRSHLEAGDELSLRRRRRAVDEAGRIAVDLFARKVAEHLAGAAEAPLDGSSPGEEALRVVAEVVAEVASEVASDSGERGRPAS